MWRLVTRRLLVSIPLVVFVSLLTFVLQSLTPGDTARAILGENFTPEAYTQLRHQLGLDQPMLVQYWHWLTAALHGDLGVSQISGLGVGAEIANRLGVTISLIIGATVVAAVLGIGLGIVSAIRPGKLGSIVDVLALAGFAMPSFWLGLVLVTLFAVMLRVFPATGYVSLAKSPSGWLVALVLPVIALAMHGMATVAKQTRDGMLTALSRDFVHVLRANGASERSITLRHGLRNAGLPVITVIGLVFISLLNGTVLVETVFAMPGLGGLAVQATTQHDVRMIQGVAVVFTMIVVVINLIVDIAYGWLNPKVRVR